MSDDTDLLRDAFADNGFEVDVLEGVESLVAAGDSDAIFSAVAVIAGAPFLATFGKEFGKLQAERADRGISALVRLISEVARRRRLLLTEYGGDRRVEILIDPDLPPEAFQQLEGPLPPARSGRLMWDSSTRRWRDAFEML